MKKTVFIISLILLFQIAIFGQDKDVCVEIRAADKVSVGENLKVYANLKIDFFTDPFLKFNWKLPKEITTEQPETVFSITKEDARKTITIKLEVEGLPDNCLKVYEKNVEAIDLQIRHYFGSPNNRSWDAEKYELSNWAIELKENESTNFYIIIYTKNAKTKKLSQRKLKIMNYLTKEQKINKERIKIAIQKSNLEKTEYWIVKKGDEPPLN